MTAFDDWLARGRLHRGEGRPADAIPCFRRAAREDPRSPVPPFHLGEVLWQLGLADDAVRAWQASADLDKSFSPPRLALAEVELTRGDFAAAADNAAQASALRPDDARAHLTAVAARAAAADDEVAEAAAAFEAQPELAASLPLPLLAALAERGVAIPAGIGARAFTLEDEDALRRLALVAHKTDPALSARLAQTYCTLVGSQRASNVPLLWPDRTAGARLRVAWLMPGPDAEGFDAARAALATVSRALDSQVALVLLCAGDAERTRAAVASDAPRDTLTMALPPEDEPGIAKAIAMSWSMRRA